MEQVQDKVLNMAIKTVYFDPIRQGVKTIEYRTIDEYWSKKLIDLDAYNGMSLADIVSGIMDGSLELHYRQWSKIVFHEKGWLNRTLEVEFLGVKTFIGHKAFCIKLGKVL